MIASTATKLDAPRGEAAAASVAFGKILVQFSWQTSVMLVSCLWPAVALERRRLLGGSKGRTGTAGPTGWDRAFARSRGLVVR